MDRPLTFYACVRTLMTSSQVCTSQLSSQPVPPDLRFALCQWVCSSWVRKMWQNNPISGLFWSFQPYQTVLISSRVFHTRRCSDFPWFAAFLIIQRHEEENEQSSSCGLFVDWCTDVFIHLLKGPCHWFYTLGLPCWCHSDVIREGGRV